MDIEHIKSLTDLMVQNDLAEIMIRDGDTRILLRRGTVASIPHVSVIPAHATTVQPASANPTAPAPALSAAGTAAAGLPSVKSPMVGTFYAAPDPDSPPFVKIGDRVNPNTVVCIIEAMKVFNEIKAEMSGIVESIEVQTGQPVEFGQVLFQVRPG
jgi:acetyl-CoA carboxylase biotin carboxyl carrier protein